jgi:hypothetical protein
MITLMTHQPTGPSYEGHSLSMLRRDAQTLTHEEARRISPAG